MNVLCKYVQEDLLFLFYYLLYIPRHDQSKIQTFYVSYFRCLIRFKEDVPVIVGTSSVQENRSQLQYTVQEAVVYTDCSRPIY